MRAYMGKTIFITAGMNVRRWSNNQVFLIRLGLEAGLVESLPDSDSNFYGVSRPDSHIQAIFRPYGVVSRHGQPWRGGYASAAVLLIPNCVTMHMRLRYQCQFETK